jgi:hypothetical protein
MAVLDKLVGNYIGEKNSNHKMKLFRKDNQLWMKSKLFASDKGKTEITVWVR